MTSKNQKKRPAPSYEEGELRDKTIEQKQDTDFKKRDLAALIRKAVQVARKPKQA